MLLRLLRRPRPRPPPRPHPRPERRSAMRSMSPTTVRQMNRQSRRPRERSLSEITSHGYADNMLRLSTTVLCFSLFGRQICPQSFSTPTPHTLHFRFSLLIFFWVWVLFFWAFLCLCLFSPYVLHRTSSLTIETASDTRGNGH